jgi:hypothetical protein
MGMIEVIPHQLWLVNVHRFFQVGALVLDYNPQPIMIPTVVHDSMLQKKIFVHDVHPDLGPIFMQYVLEATLPDGNILIVDPTARQYGFQGPYGTLIVHAKWEEYCDTFPGIVGDKVRTSVCTFFGKENC